MPQKTSRVIQWMTGDVGQVGVRHCADCPVYDLVEVLVHSKKKVGKDAIPNVCDAAAGWVTHLDLGLVQPRGLVRK